MEEDLKGYIEWIQIAEELAGQTGSKRIYNANGEPMSTGWVDLQTKFETFQ